MPSQSPRRGPSLTLSPDCMLVLPYDANNENFPIGARCSPSFTLTNSPLTLVFRPEFGVSHRGTFDIGDNYFESSVSGTFNNRVFGDWVYTPSGSDDPWRATFSVRELSVRGVWQDFSLLLGRMRVEQTDFQRRFRTVYPQFTNFTQPSIAYTWLNGELSFNHRNNTGLFKQIQVRAAYMDGVNASYLLSLQSLGILRFSASDQLVLSAHYIYRQNERSGNLQEFGQAHSFGGSAIFERSRWRAGVGYGEMDSSWVSAQGFAAQDYRRQLNVLFGWNNVDRNWLVEAGLSFMFRERLAGRNATESVNSQTDVQGNLCGSRRLADGLMVSACMLANLEGLIPYVGMSFTPNLNILRN